MLRFAPFLTLSRHLGHENRLCFGTSASALLNSKASFVYLSVAKIHYLRCSHVLRLSHVTCDECFQLRTPGHSRSNFVTEYA